MSIIRKIKSLLPASSRSLHAMHEELAGMLRQQQEERAAFEGKTSVMLWELYRREGETMEEAHHRFFESMAPASGSMRLYQLASAQLLHELDALCQREGIGYWVVSGTLLGAVRHKGFIPWDDDLDVGMMTPDIDRLIAAVEADERHRVTVRYDRKALCRQVRFAFADENIPCFVDLFPFDLVAHDDAASFDAREQAREELKRALLADDTLGFWNDEDFYADPADPRCAAIAGYFDAAVRGLHDKGVLVDDPARAEAVVWSIVNTDSFVSHHTWYQIPLTAILPFCRLPFEGAEVNAPADYNRCLSDIYGDIYQLPDDLASHFQHVGSAELADYGVVSALRSVIDSNC